MISLTEELDLWGAAGYRASFWWRDDDAGSPRPEFSNLMDLSQNLAIPLSVAVIPAAARTELFDQVDDMNLVSILQHGWSHSNHEPGGHGPSELGDARSPEDVIEELTLGRSRLLHLFGPKQVQPVLVPPWHSISLQVVKHLPQIEIHSISLMGRRNRPVIAPGVSLINVDVDLVRWADDPPRFIGSERAAGLLTTCLRARRLNQAEKTEPIGIMTHHWAMGSGGLNFLAALGRLINHHPAACWMSPCRPVSAPL